MRTLISILCILVLVAPAFSQGTHTAYLYEEVSPQYPLLQPPVYDIYLSIVDSALDDSSSTVTASHTSIYIGMTQGRFPKDIAFVDLGSAKRIIVCHRGYFVGNVIVSEIQVSPGPVQIVGTYGVGLQYPTCMAVSTTLQRLLIYDAVTGTIADLDYLNLAGGPLAHIPTTYTNIVDDDEVFLECVGNYACLLEGEQNPQNPRRFIATEVDLTNYQITSQPLNPWGTFLPSDRVGWKHAVSNGIIPAIVTPFQCEAPGYLQTAGVHVWVPGIWRGYHPIWTPPGPTFWETVSEFGVNSGLFVLPTNATHSDPIWWDINSFLAGTIPSLSGQTFLDLIYIPGKQAMYLGNTTSIWRLDQFGGASVSGFPYPMISMTFTRGWASNPNWFTMVGNAGGTASPAFMNANLETMYVSGPWNPSNGMARLGNGESMGGRRMRNYEW